MTKPFNNHNYYERRWKAENPAITEESMRAQFRNLHMYVYVEANRQYIDSPLRDESVVVTGVTLRYGAQYWSILVVKDLFINNHLYRAGYTHDSINGEAIKPVLDMWGDAT